MMVALFKSMVAMQCVNPMTKSDVKPWKKALRETAGGLRNDEEPLYPAKKIWVFAALLRNQHDREWQEQESEDST